MRLIDTEEYDILKDLAFEAKNLVYSAMCDDRAFQRAIARLEAYEAAQEANKAAER